MITEDYVSFEIAKLLREKGFNEPCFAYYDLFHDSTGTTLKLYKKFPRNPLNKQYLNVPTLQAAMKWLRKNHKIDIIPFLVSHETVTIDQKYYGIKVYISRRLKNFPRELYKTPEEACEAAIKYCLENLI